MAQAYVGDAARAGRKLVFDHGALRTVATDCGALPGGIAAFARETGPLTPVASPLPDARDLAYRGPSARAAARALREALARGERAATPAALDELHDLLRLADAP